MTTELRSASEGETYLDVHFFGYGWTRIKMPWQLITNWSQSEGLVSAEELNRPRIFVPTYFFVEGEPGVALTLNATVRDGMMKYHPIEDIETALARLEQDFPDSVQVKDARAVVEGYKLLVQSSDFRNCGSWTWRHDRPIAPAGKFYGEDCD